MAYLTGRRGSTPRGSLCNPLPPVSEGTTLQNTSIKYKESKSSYNERSDSGVSDCISHFNCDSGFTPRKQSVLRFADQSYDRVDDKPGSIRKHEAKDSAFCDDLEENESIAT